MPVQLEMMQKKSEPIVGIDLGTTNSLVAIVEDGRPHVLKTREGKNLLPSVVSFVDGKPTFGATAKRNKVTHPQYTIYSVKRLLGRGFEDLKSAEVLPYEVAPSEAGDEVVRIRIGQKSYTAVEISALILKELKKAAQQALGRTVSQAVITVPAYFNDAQRQATRAAGRLAGWDVLRIVNEPTAAALAYGLNRKNEGLIAVYDLGGGTFDLSILKLSEGIFEVLATHGDTQLGGDDLDQAMVREVAKDLKEQWDFDLYLDPNFYAVVLEKAEQVKIALSADPGSPAFLELSYQGRTYQRSWSEAQFSALARPILEKTRSLCLDTLKDAKVHVNDLTDVVLVGGPTRLRVVQDLVREIFGRTPNTSVHPDEVVAQGAAIQADILAGNTKDLLLLDVVPLSLGIETYGGIMSPLIPRNTRIPTVAREEFTTFADFQTGVDIHVLQGEREKVADNRSLARFKLSGIEPSLAGQPRIEVTFLVDADGILQVSAKDLKTEKAQTIEVRPSYGLSANAIEKMLEAGLEHAEEDVSYRQLIEARNQAEPILRAAEKKLPDALRLLPEPQICRIKDAIQGLRTALNQENIQEIQEAASHLNHSTHTLAELVVKEALSKRG